MVEWFQYGLYFVLLIALFLSVFNSLKSHRTRDTRMRGLYTARMNISLGVMLLTLAFIQMFVFSGSSLRVIIGALFMVLGLFNIYAGIRNHSHFSKSTSS